MKRILGLDPGETTGWGLVSVDGDVPRCVDHGVIAAPGTKPSEAEVLTTTRRHLVAMLEVMKADGVERVAIEAPIGGKFVNWLTGEVRGVCKEAVAAAGLGWYLIPPQTAKAILGVKPRRKGELKRGPDAAKKAVKAAVEARFGLSGLSYHEADALACALAYAAEKGD
jgi:Holliday junction resolvasome RuvABC endonuclease subunit